MTSQASNVALTNEQASVLAFIVERVESRDEIEVLNFRLSGKFGGIFHAAVLDIGKDEEGDSIRLVVTLPTYSQGVFLALTVSQPREVARLLANLEDYERETGHSLDPLETVVTDGPGDVKALFLLRTASHAEMSSIPDSALISAKEHKFSLVVGIDATEYSCKCERGVDALLNVLQSSGKSLIFSG